MAAFDPDLTSKFDDELLIRGETTDIKVKDHDGHPNHVLDPNLPFTMTIKWRLEGQLVPLYLDWPKAEFEVKVFAEAMGPGPEIELKPSVRIPTFGDGAYEGTYYDRTYTADLEIAAKQLPEHMPGGVREARASEPCSGVYKLVATVWRNGSIPGPYDVVGFDEGPIIQMECSD